MITQVEPDTRECEVKWDLGSITINKASEGDGIPAELFQTLNNDAVKVLPSVQFSRSVMSDSLRPHELQSARSPCPSPTPGVHSNSCSSSW